MGFPIKLLIGFFIGFLCGLIPFLYGFLTNHRILAIIALSVTTLTGILFSSLDKQPFTAMVVSILFVLVNFAESKRNSKNKNSDKDNK